MWGLGVRVTVLHTRQPQPLKGSSTCVLLLEVVEMGFEPRFASLLYHDEFLSRHFWLSGCSRSLSYCLQSVVGGWPIPWRPPVSRGHHGMLHTAVCQALPPPTPPGHTGFSTWLGNGHQLQLPHLVSVASLMTTELFLPFPGAFSVRQSFFFFCSWLMNLE